MDKIVVKNTSVEINDYNFGDCPKLERFFAIYEPVSHTYKYVAIHYDSENKKLYLPRGIDIWYVEQLLQEPANVLKDSYNPFDRYNDIKIKSLPRSEDQVKALRFALGKGEYSATQTKSQLQINLNTGKGKTYVALGTIQSAGIKSIIITYSVNVLNQWKAMILKHTNITAKEICDVSGSGAIFRLLTKSPQEIYKYKIFLVTHSTLKSYGDTYGWNKVEEFFKHIRVGLKFYDEAHTNFDCMCMIDYYSSVYKSYYLTATPGRSNDEENRIYQTAFKNVLAIDLFHKDTDPHTHYIAIRYNSKPTPVIISKCKNKYGLDRNKYTNYIVTNERFKRMSVYVLDFIFSKILLNPEDKMIIYIGTNEAIATFYQWIVEIFPQVKNNIGIFTSVVNIEDKSFALTRQIILTTTKSAGAAIDIKGLKCTLVLAEPFKSDILARQTLGRTRDNDTYYIEIVDKGFRYCNKFFLDKKSTFNMYALDTAIVDLSDIEINEGYNKIVKISTNITPRLNLVKPFTYDRTKVTKILS